MATADLPRTLPYQPLRMSVERYHELARLGAFADHDRVELLDGVVTEKMAKNPPHTFATRGCDLALSKLASPGWHIRNQEPITLTASEPEPDVAIIRGKREVYAQRHPLPSEVALVIEVADTSLVTDHYKAELYAAAGIAEYWIVNLAEQIVEVYRLPAGKGSVRRYDPPRIYRPESTIPLEVAGEAWGELRVAEVLGG